MIRFLLALCVALTFVVAVAVPDQDLEGYWLTVDDAMHQPRSIVHLVPDHGRYQGRIEHVFLRADEATGDLCKLCPGVQKNKPYVGLTIVWNMQTSGSGAIFQNGNILDPKKGHVYGCRLSLEEGGHVLSVRGYLGLPALGRTQKWHRIPADKVDQWKEFTHIESLMQSDLVKNVAV